MNVVPQQISHEARNYAILSVVDNYGLSLFGVGGSVRW